MIDPFPALLITLEGIDGSGKSTQVGLLVQRLAELDLEPLAVREPGGARLSERVRDLLLDPDGTINPRAELLLFAAARAQLVAEVIRPALEMGRPVVCDRFYDSTTAYQGGGRQLAGYRWLTDFHRFTTGGLIPDRTYIIDVPPEVAAARRAESADRMEAAGEAFFERVRDTYRQLAQTEPERIRLLDGTASPVDLHETLWRDLSDLVHGTAHPGFGYPPAT